MRLRRCLSGKLTVGHTMYVAVHCALKDLPKKQALFFTVEENKLPLIGKEVYSSIINYLHVWAGGNEGTGSRQLLSCCSACCCCCCLIGIRYQLSFIIVISRCHVCHCLSCVEMPLWKKKSFSSVTEKQSCLSDWNKESSLDPRLLFLGFVLWSLNDLSAAPFWSSSRFVFFSCPLKEWLSHCIYPLTNWPWNVTATLTGLGRVDCPLCDPEKTHKAFHSAFCHWSSHTCMVACISTVHHFYIVNQLCGNGNIF